VSSTEQSKDGAADALVAAARRGLAEAELCRDAAGRYCAAHIAALRAAAAVLAVRARPTRRGPTSVWLLLPRVAPALNEWAEFFAAGARKRAAAEIGLSAVSQREADDLLRDAGRFISVVEDLLGLDQQLTLTAFG
jgi:SAV_6107-like HEPN